jgi:hypothetical protein
MGWATNDATVYLLILDESSRRGAWSFYVNGHLSYECEDHFWNPVARLFRRLMKDPKLREIDRMGFLDLLINRALPWEYREHAAQVLSQTICSQPAIWQALKHSFFDLLCQELEGSEWPTLDLLKVQRLEYKNLLLKFISKLHETSGILSQADRQELTRLVSAIHRAYHELLTIIKPGMRVQCHQVYLKFLRLSEELVEELPPVYVASR